MKRIRILLSLLVALSCVTACGGGAHEIPEYPPFEPLVGGDEEPSEEEPPTREPPPVSGPTTDVRFPTIAHRTVRGLAVDVVENHALPTAHLVFVVRSGSDSDPESLPGLASFVAQMLKEGTRTKSAEALAGAFDEIGARYSVAADQESIYVAVSVLSDQLPAALSLMAEMITQPAFDATELGKLKRRERDRLELESQDPNWLGRRALRRELYGDHPYGHVDTTPRAVEQVRREDLVAWHRAHFVPSNCLLVAGGDVEPDAFATQLGRAFRSFRGGTAPEVTFPTLPARTGRSIVVVDRPGSVQSSIRVANLAIRRSSPDYVPLTVANHVLGGGANARLFVDLREQRGLTYGAYSAVIELTEIAPFAASTAVRTAVTVEALSGIFEHLERIRTSPIPEDELAFAQRYLADSFPLQIDTPAKVVHLLAQQRIFGLPEGYWDHYRSAIAEVTPETALAAAQAYIRPSEAVVVIVGESSAFAEDLTAFGPVRVVDADFATLRELPARAP